MLSDDEMREVVQMGEAFGAEVLQASAVRTPQILAKHRALWRERFPDCPFPAVLALPGDAP